MKLTVALLGALALVCGAAHAQTYPFSNAPYAGEKGTGTPSTSDQILVQQGVTSHDPVGSPARMTLGTLGGVLGANASITGGTISGANVSGANSTTVGVGTHPLSGWLGVMPDLRRQMMLAATNNPRVNGAMATPPAITVTPLWLANTAYSAGATVVNTTGAGASSVGYWYTETAANCTSAPSGGPQGSGTGITDGTCAWTSGASHPTNRFAVNASANSYLWNTGTGAAGVNGAVDFQGGVPANDPTTSCEATHGPTVTGGVPSIIGGKWQFNSDATYVVVRLFNPTTSSSYRILVNGQYASLSATTLAPSGWGYALLDFSSAGGRALRTITVENENNTFFCGVDVGITEGVYRPIKRNTLTVVTSGDSFTASAGADMRYDGFIFLMCDYFGSTNCISEGIGGTGYLRTSASGTAIQRIADITSAVAASPNAIVIDENGYNDASFFPPDQIQAACLAYMQALRAALPGVPIIELGINAAMNGGAGWTDGVAAENAKKAAIATMNDPLIFFVPSIAAPGGSMMTGTGNDQSPNGTGNSDIYTNGTSLPHSNTIGHAFMTQQWLSGLRQVLGTAGY